MRSEHEAEHLVRAIEVVDGRRALVAWLGLGLGLGLRLGLGLGLGVGVRVRVGVGVRRAVVTVALSMALGRSHVRVERLGGMTEGPA